MDNKTICQILNPLFELQSEANGNASYELELARLIQATGKSANDLTVGEILRLCNKADKAYRQLCAKGAI